MATKTKAASTICANSKYKKPKPPIPATDPKYIQNLWQQVRKQQREHMSYNQQEKYMADTAASAKKKKAPTLTPSTTVSDVLRSSRAPSTAPTLNTQSITIKSRDFREQCLTPRGIYINNGPPVADPYLHFHTQKPPSYTELAGLGKSTLWLETNATFIKRVNREYAFMERYQLCEAEYASYAKETLLRREPRERILDNTADPSQRFRRSERMLEFPLKPDEDNHWEPPPFLSSSDKQKYPTYTFDIRPDCNYWLSLHAFNSEYSGQMEGFVYVPQERMTCPYFTVEFKRDDSEMKKANNQAATSGALALYNRYRLRRRVPTLKWTHDQECQLRHYILTITKSKYKFWCIRPNLKDGNWDGCTMTTIFLASLNDEQGVKNFVNWINEIHRWGLTNHIESCEKDIKLLLENQRFRTSDIEPRKECTCNDSRDDT
ncbi:MAG: hypothetical protein Q9167_002819 [Letrouitia subvulpina]